MKIFNPARRVGTDGPLPAIAFTTTTSDTVPSVAPQHVDRLEAGERQAMTLNSGERLWFAVLGATQAVATLEV